MTTNVPVDRMELHALAEPGRLLTILSERSHPDRAVRKQFRSSFGRYFDEYPVRFPLVASNCPFCSSNLIVAEKAFICNDVFESAADHPAANVTIIDDSFDIRGLDLLDHYGDLEIPEFFGAIEYCRSCRYWRFHYYKTDTVPRGCGLTLSYSSIVAKKREYERELPEGVPAELAAWLRRTPSGWFTMNSRRFERLVADVFKRNHASAEVHHIGRPNDGGVDVLLIESDGKQWLVQVKRRETPNACEGISTIRNLLGAMVLKGTHYGVVVSTADHFSYRAWQAVGLAHQRGMVLRLIDKVAFDRMLDHVLPDRPWLSLVLERFPVFGSHLSSIIQSDRQLQLFD